MTPSIPIDRAKAQAVINSGQAQHLAPIFMAALDHDCRVLILKQAQKPVPFRVPEDRPCIAIVGDDLDAALGPPAFHGPSLRRFLRSCGGTVIVVAEPSIGLYGAAAAIAVVGRENIAIIETREDREADWYEFIVATKPMPVLIHTTPTEGTA